MTTKIDCRAGDMREPRREEAIARDLLAPHVNGQLVSIPDPPDFALCREDEVIGWVEVTTAVDGENLALHEWLKKNGEPFTSGKLTHTWTVRFRREAKLNNLDRDQLIDLLAAYEADHPEKDKGVYEYHQRFRTPAMLFKRFGIQFATFMPTTGEPTVYLEGPGFGSSVGPSLVNDLAVEKAVMKADSLAFAEGERHLAVLVNADWPTGAWFALTETEVPEDAPDLPDSITDIWLSGVTSLLWHFSTKEASWEVIHTGE